LFALGIFKSNKIINNKADKTIHGGGDSHRTLVANRRGHGIQLEINNDKLNVVSEEMFKD